MIGEAAGSLCSCQSPLPSTRSENLVEDSLGMQAAASNHWDGKPLTTCCCCTTACCKHEECGTFCATGCRLQLQSRSSIPSMSAS